MRCHPTFLWMKRGMPRCRFTLPASARANTTQTQMGHKQELHASSWLQKTKQRGWNTEQSTSSVHHWNPPFLLQMPSPLLSEDWEKQTELIDSRTIKFAFSTKVLGRKFTGKRKSQQLHLKHMFYYGNLLACPCKTLYEMVDNFSSLHQVKNTRCFIATQGEKSCCLGFTFSSYKQVQ